MIFRRRLHRQIAGLFVFEDAMDIGGGGGAAGSSQAPTPVILAAPNERSALCMRSIAARCSGALGLHRPIRTGWRFSREQDSSYAAFEVKSMAGFTKPRL